MSEQVEAEQRVRAVHPEAECVAVHDECAIAVRSADGSAVYLSGFHSYSDPAWEDAAADLPAHPEGVEAGEQELRSDRTSITIIFPRPNADEDDADCVYTTNVHALTDEDPASVLMRAIDELRRQLDDVEKCPFHGEHVTKEHVEIWDAIHREESTASTLRKTRRFMHALSPDEIPESPSPEAILIEELSKEVRQLRNAWKNDLPLVPAAISEERQEAEPVRSDAWAELYEAAKGLSEWTRDYVPQRMRDKRTETRLDAALSRYETQQEIQAAESALSRVPPAEVRTYEDGFATCRTEVLSILADSHMVPSDVNDAVCRLTPSRAEGNKAQ